MMITRQFLTLVVCALLGFCVAVEYAVGYSLSLDYGTASVYFKNHTYIDAAKIEGSGAYKQFMRSKRNIGNGSDYDCRPISSLQVVEQDPIQLKTQQKRDRPLPPKNVQGDQSIPALEGMLRALRTSVESVLDTSVPDGSVTASYPMSEHFIRALNITSTAVGLKLTERWKRPAGLYAAIDLDEYNSEGRCEPYGDRLCHLDEQVILTVDYSRAGLTAAIILESDRVFQLLRVYHDPLVGIAALAANPGHLTAPYLPLAGAFSNLANVSVINGCQIGQDNVDTVLFLGEGADDPAMNAAFYDAFKPKIRPGRFRAGEPRLFWSPSPAYAGARGLAMAELYNQLYIEETRYDFVYD